MKRTGFPNRAGDHPDTDEVLTDELHAAGIPTIWENEKSSPTMLALIRNQSGEVKTSTIGCLSGWTFKRAWYYWIATGPGIEVAAAERLHAEYGKVVRVNGSCVCPSPAEEFGGLACGVYHVDTAEGLLALANTIRKLTTTSQRTKKPKLIVQPYVNENQVVEHIAKNLNLDPTADTFTLSRAQLAAIVGVTVKGAMDTLDATYHTTPLHLVGPLIDLSQLYEQQFAVPSEYIAWCDGERVFTTNQPEGDK